MPVQSEKKNRFQICLSYVVGTGPYRMLSNDRHRFETETTPIKAELGFSCVYCNHCLSFSFRFILLFSFSGLIGVEETVERGYCKTMNEHNKVISILALAEKAGMSTGFISTAHATDATPACLYAHSADRDFESDNDLKLEAKDDPSNCTDIGRWSPQRGGRGVLPGKMYGDTWRKF